MAYDRRCVSGEGQGEFGVGGDGGKGDEAFSPVGCFMVDAEHDCEGARCEVCC